MWLERWRSRRPWACVLVALVVSSTVLRAAAALRVTPLVRDDRLLISFELSGGLPEELRPAIEGGLRTTFVYLVELKLEVPVWVDPTIGSAVVAHSVQFDTLWRRYQLVRTVDGRVDAAEVTDDPARVERWLTTLDRLPLFPTRLLEPNRDYYVRIRLRTRPPTAFPWPWASGPSGQAKFTFVR
jgi:hypothetical protein